MIGVSLPYKQLARPEEHGALPDGLLAALFARGVRSIELRTVSPSADPADVLRVAKRLWEQGFQITLHVHCRTQESAVSDVFAPLSCLLAHLRQRELMLTLHPIRGDNAAMLVALSDHILSQGYPVRIALENNRRLPDKSDGDSAALVLDAVTRAARENVGICFDMGHYAWYAATQRGDHELLPPRAFLSRVIHTHIHAFCEGTTHYPLDGWKKTLSLYLDALDYKYYGVYNIELSPERFAHRCGVCEGYLGSVDTLRAHYPLGAAFYDEQRVHCDAVFSRSREVLTRKTGAHVALIAPSSYLFSTNGYRWAMDVAFQHLGKLAGTSAHVRELLSDLDLMLLTHAHGDHMEKRTIRALCDTAMRFVAPECMREELLALGVRPERLVTVREGELLDIGPLHIRVLRGRHFRPDGKGIASVGYLITAENAPSLAFPGDVRDYSVADGEALDADYCFAHVWLGDDALAPEQYLPFCAPFADFMLRRSQKSILLAHLLADREAAQRWTPHHADAVAKAIRERSPETEVHTLRYGEILTLK